MEPPSNNLSPYNSPINNQLRQPINYDKSDIEPISNHHKISWVELSFTNTSCQTESKALFKLGIPIGFSIATRLLQYFTDQSMVGHLGTDYLAASSLAGILMTISGTYIYAFCGTINVLCSQAYGSGNLKRVSEWMQLGCIMAMILTIPTFILYYFTEDILLSFGTSKHIAKLSGEFTKWSMFTILPNSQFMATRMYFKAQSNVLPSTYVSAIMLVFNLCVNLVLVYGYGVSWIMHQVNGTHWDGLGFIGSPIATAITRTTQYFLYIFWMFGYKKYHKETWSKLKLSTFSCKRVKKFVKVAIPQTISSALEDWQIQIIGLFALKLHEADLAAFSSSITIILICHTMSIGISDAVSVRVANFLGANKPQYARYIAWVGIVIALTIGGIIGGLLATVGKYLAYVVSGRHEIYVIYQEVFPVVGGALFLLSVFTIVVGILVAQARTVGLAVSALIGCWGISVPMSYMMGIYWGYGIRGIWYGIIMGYTVFASSCFVIFFKTDWKKCAEQAVKRNIDTQNNNDIEDSFVSNRDDEIEQDKDIMPLYNSLMSDDYSVTDNKLTIHRLNSDDNDQRNND